MNVVVVDGQAYMGATEVIFSVIYPPVDSKRITHHTIIVSLCSRQIQNTVSRYGGL